MTHYFGYGVLFFTLSDRCFRAAFRTVFLVVDHQTGRPAVAACPADMRPLHRSRAVNALHDLLVGFKGSFTRFGTAFAAISVLLAQRRVTMAAACRIGCDPAIILGAAARTFLVPEMKLRSAASASSLRIDLTHCDFSFRMTDVIQNIG